MEEKKVDEYTVATSIAGSDDTDEQQPSEEAIAKRLREKIRLQAEDLLNRVDSIRDGGGTTFPASRMVSPSLSSSSSSLLHRPSSQRGGGATATQTMAAATTTTTTTAPSLESFASLAAAASPTSTYQQNSSSSSSSLTKRLQALALQQRANRIENNAERLRLIQNESLFQQQQQNGQLRSTTVTSFSELSLPQWLLDGIYSLGYDRPSAIQATSLPIILQGRNLMGQAQSGSGKTAAFCIGMLSAIDVMVPSPQAICVVPTRELAIQILEQTIAPLCRFIDPTLFSTQLAISQMSLLKNGSSSSKKVTSQIVVGTPGKVVDWLKRKYIDGKTIKVLVLDEADEMVDTHRANSLLIRKHLPLPQLQTLLFSATFNDSTMEFADKFFVKSNQCDRILIDSEDLVLSVIKQVWIDTRNNQGISKLEFLADIYSILTIAQSIVFVNTKTDADKVYSTLSDSGYTCSVIHSGIEDRDTVMQEFRSGTSNVLISTNVLARGVDVDAVCLVINYDVPIDKDGKGDAETYLHRIGRTGRFGRKGTAINFCDSDEAVSALADIEKYYKTNGDEMIHQVAADPEALAAAIEI